MAARPWLLAVPIVAGLFVAAPFMVPSWILFILHLALAKFLVVLAVALFLRGGLVSFGHALFYAVGAYTAGFAAKWFGVREALLLIPLGGLFGAAVAAVIGLFMARYRGVFFAMLNLAVSMILYAILLKFYWLTGGTDGLRVQTPTLLGFVPPRDLIRMTSYYVALVVAGVMTYVVYRFLASPSGIISRPWRTTKSALNTRENRCSASSTQPTCSPVHSGDSVGSWWPLRLGISSRNTPSGPNPASSSSSPCSGGTAVCLGR